MVLNPDFVEFIKLLNDRNVLYLVVDGYAVAFHGYPRYTKDIDIWIYPDKKNAEKVIEVLKDFGFESLGLTLEDFSDPEQIIQLGRPPNRIDLMMDLEGVKFRECYSAKVEVDVDGINANFLDLNNLKKNKKATGRHQDLADLENLS
ncbi:MAG: hypothetical protein GWN62_04990 [Aliifodinibius sp.]|nr:hypothetical protein [Fodinibius sp.]